MLFSNMVKGLFLRRSMRVSRVGCLCIVNQQVLPRRLRRVGHERRVGKIVKVNRRWIEVVFKEEKCWVSIDNLMNPNIIDRIKYYMRLV